METRAPGDLDFSFGTDGLIDIRQEGTANSIICDSDGKLILVVQVDGPFGLLRYLLNGDKDESFHDTVGYFEDGYNSSPTRVLLQEDGKILLIGGSSRGTEWRPALMRFYATGSHDIVFGRKIITTSPEHAYFSGEGYKRVDGCLQKDQKILLCANYLTHEENISSSTESRLYRLLANGEADSDFGEKGGFIEIRFHDQPSYACNVQIQSDGKIIVAGSWRYEGEQQRTRTVARYTSEGELDVTFGAEGYADIVVTEEQLERALPDRFEPDIVSHVAIQDDDKILVAGYAKDPDGTQSGLMARMEANGKIDESFNGGKPLLVSRTSYQVAFYSLAIQPDGKIVSVGKSFVRGKPNNITQAYERVNQRGEIEGFWRDDSDGKHSDVTIQPNGRVVVSGSSGTNTVPYPRVCGYLGA